jgi:hypothetical protein
MSTKVKTKLPKPTAAELELQDINVLLAKQQLDATQQLADLQRFQFDLAEPGLRRSAAEQEAYNKLFTPEQQAQQLADQTAQAAKMRALAIEDLERGGAASPEQVKLIGEATDAQIEGARSDIEEFQQRGMRLLSRELAPSLGLRPGDTPILDRGGELQQEGLRQFGQISRGARAAEAQARLNFPLAVSNLMGNQINFNTAAQDFQSSLRQQSFNNRMAQLGQTGNVGLGLTGAPFNSAGSLAALQQPRLASATQTTGGFGHTASLINAGGANFGCWVAAEYYGWFTPDWFAARRWIMEGWRGPVADEFRRLYMQHGSIWAEMVRGDGRLREALRPLFDWARRKGRRC